MLFRSQFVFEAKKNIDCMIHNDSKVLWFLKILIEIIGHKDQGISISFWCFRVLEEHNPQRIKIIFAMLE